jgi:2'-5' RNA ligase
MPSGVMICLPIPDLVAEKLAVEGGEPPESMHVTLAYVPGIAGDQDARVRIQEAISPLARTIAPLKGKIGGVGLFRGSETSDWKDVIYASYDSPGLFALRIAVLDALESAGFEASRKHGFTPHVTLKYVEPGQAVMPEVGYSLDFEIDQIVVADREEWTEFETAGTIVLKGQPGNSDVHVKAPIGGKMRGKKKKEEPEATQDAEDEKPPTAPMASGGPQEGGSMFPPENNQGVGFENAIYMEFVGILKALDVDVPEAMAELAQIDDSELEESTAGKWAARAIAAFMLAAWCEEDEERCRYVDWGDELYHEALEHGALVKDEGRTVSQVQEIVDPYRSKVVGADEVAKAALEAAVEAVTVEVPIQKIDSMKQIAYGVVLEPETVDLQGDRITEDEIEKTAHDYLENSRKAKERHRNEIDAFPVESYIAPQDLHWYGGPFGDQVVKKGSWVVGMKYRDPDVWRKVETGEYTGFSVGGTGVREPY